MYDWRKMSNEQREQAKLRRRALGHPKHSPPHWDLQGDCQYLITAACYEHAHIIGQSPERMTECETEILKVFRQFCAEIYAWCVLPNHLPCADENRAYKRVTEGIREISRKIVFSME